MNSTLTARGLVAALVLSLMALPAAADASGLSAGVTAVGSSRVTPCDLWSRLHPYSGSDSSCRDLETLADDLTRTDALPMVPDEPSSAREYASGDAPVTSRCRTPGSPR